MTVSLRLDVDGQRITALAVSLLLHLAIVLALFAVLGDRSEPITALHDEPIFVRLIPDSPRAAPGPPADEPAPSARAQTLPTSANLRPKIARIELAATPREKPRAQARAAVLTLEPLPPPQRDDAGRPSSLLPGAAASLASSSNTARTDGDQGRGGGGMGSDSNRIQFLSKVRPRLPSSMKGSRWSGYTLLGLRIDVNGKPVEVVVLRSSSFASIDAAAKRAATASTYLPHRADGKPIERWAVVPVVFGSAVPNLELDLAEQAAKWRALRPGTGRPFEQPNRAGQEIRPT